MKRRLLWLLITSSVMLSIKAQNFKTINIGGQVWMAENLSISIPGSWNYNDDPNIGRKYGRLYTWDAAKNSCPTGWHLPTDQEWAKMIDYAGGEGQAGKQLKTGSNFGFNALLGGMSSPGNYFLLNQYGAFWCASEFDKEHAWYFFVTSDKTIITKTYFNKNYGFSVRCVKNVQ